MSKTTFGENGLYGQSALFIFSQYLEEMETGARSAPAYAKSTADRSAFGVGEKTARMV